jgi:hypothetical protein
MFHTHTHTHTGFPRDQSYRGQRLAERQQRKRGTHSRDDDGQVCMCACVCEVNSKWLVVWYAVVCVSLCAPLLTHPLTHSSQPCSLFELVDMWVPSTNVDAYVEFLDIIFSLPMFE